MNRGYKSFYKDYFGIDFQNKKVDIKLDIPSKGWQDLIDDFKEYKTVEVFLSGGVDSMWKCLMMKKLNIPFHATTYRYEDNFNDYEVDEAERFCRDHNIKHYIKDINLKNFYESGEYETYSDIGQTSSPFYSLFLKWLKDTNSDMTLICGTPPVLLLNDDDFKQQTAETKGVELDQWSIHKEHYGTETIGDHQYPLICYGTDAGEGGLLRGVEKLKQPCITNLCYYSPKILLDDCKKAIEFQKQFKKVYPHIVFSATLETKAKMFNYVYDLKLPMHIKKHTGFEKIKEYYKDKYNVKFNKLFREPLLEKYPNTMIDVSIGGVINDLPI